MFTTEQVCNMSPMFNVFTRPTVSHQSVHLSHLRDMTSDQRNK